MNKNYQRESVQINSVQNLAPIVRRLYRLFSHTYFSHNEVFNEFEVKYYRSNNF